MTPMGLPTDAQVLLLLQADGSPAAVEADAKQILDALNQSGAKVARLAKDDAEAAMFWKARSAGFAAIFGAAHTVLAEDVAVPRDKLAEFIQRLGEISKKSGFFIEFIGHAGDGNLHPLIMTDLRDKEEMARVDKALVEMYEAAIAMGGTLSGEHGIGIAKDRFMSIEFSQSAIDIMRGIKNVFDPNNILNPGSFL